MHKRISAGIAAGALVLGAGGVAIMIPSLVAAADPTSSPSATQSTTSAQSTTAPSTSGSTTTANCDGPMGGGPMGSDDITAAATALGMTEADVTAALQNGQALADLAATQNVDVQTLIDAMVAAEKAEIQAQVDAGAITQAQADQQIANLTQHETDEVNGTFSGGGPGGHGRHGQPSTTRRRRPTANEHDLDVQLDTQPARGTDLLPSPAFQFQELVERALRGRHAGASEDVIDHVRFGVGVVLRVFPRP